MDKVSVCCLSRRTAAWTLRTQLKLGEHGRCMRPQNFEDKTGEPVVRETSPEYRGQKLREPDVTFGPPYTCVS